MKNVYVIDASALIDATRNYNMTKTTFSPIWSSLETLIADGELITSSEILDELKDDQLINWVKNHKNMSIPLTEEIQKTVIEVLSKYPTLIKMKSTSNSNGDPFLVATAIVYNGCVITNEKIGDEKSGDYHIPNVCKGFGVPYMDLPAFLDKIIC